MMGKLKAATNAIFPQRKSLLWTITKFIKAAMTAADLNPHGTNVHVEGVTENGKTCYRILVTAIVNLRNYEASPFNFGFEVNEKGQVTSTYYNEPNANINYASIPVEFSTLPGSDNSIFADRFAKVVSNVRVLNSDLAAKFAADVEELNSFSEKIRCLFTIIQLAAARDEFNFSQEIENQKPVTAMTQEESIENDPDAIKLSQRTSEVIISGNRIMARRDGRIVAMATPEGDKRFILSGEMYPKPAAKFGTVHEVAQGLLSYSQAHALAEERQKVSKTVKSE